MRLLFIYFYEEKATFEKGTVIRFSKKYNVSKEDITVSDDKKIFDIKLTENENYQDNFYSLNSDIGILIGENGTGKSVLLNSIRDMKNDYSICIYEEGDKFHILENDLLKLKRYKSFDIHEYESDFLVRINDIKIEYKSMLKSIYYSSILESASENLDDHFNISDINLLNKINEPDLNKKIEQLEINDLQRMNNFKYPIKIDISPTFFDDAKNLMKNSYLLLFEKTMQLLKDNKDDEKIDKIFSKLPKFILDDINKYYLEDNELFIKEVKNNKDTVDKYIKEYKKAFFGYLEKNKNDISNKLLDMEKRLNKNKNEFYCDRFFKDLSQIVFAINESNKLYIISKIKKIFGIKTLWSSDDPKDLEEKIFHFLVVEKVFEKCLKKLKLKKDKTDDEEKNFNILKVYYLKQELGYLNYIQTDLFKKGRFKDILLVHNVPVDCQNNAYREHKERTKNAIKQFIEANYSLFYNTVINNLEVLNDKEFILLILGKLEKFAEQKEEGEVISDIDKAIYTYLTRLLTIKKLQKEEKNKLRKILNIRKYEDIQDILIHNYHEFKNYIIDNDTEEDFNIDKYKNFVTDAVHPYSFTFDPPISSGQKAKETIYARINHIIQKINIENQSENILILLDEADLKLHLEWQRKFVSDLIEFLNSHSNNKFYILYATHSPMILSDITDDRVVFLQNKDGYSTDVSENTEKKKRTFGANIYDIYNDSFFMNSFVGEFAETKINEVIDIINITKSIKNDKKLEMIEDKFLKSYNHFFNKSITKEIVFNEYKNILTDTKKQNKISQTVNLIGEPILKNKLIDDINYIFDNDDNIDEIIQTLKTKSYEDIHTELQKHPQPIQNKILSKLFKDNQ